MGKKKQDKKLPEQLYREALAIEKLILQNPSFVPYDSFAKIFEELKGNISYNSDSYLVAQNVA